MLKIATWNVNGVRARQAQLEEWLARERPDVVCLQEIKAALDQVPESLRERDDYWCRWHGGKGYSGVAVLVRKEAFPDTPPFSSPAFDFETRILVVTLGRLAVASVYVPNGGKDFQAKIRFLEAMDEYARAAEAANLPVVLCGDLNVTRTDMDVHPKERKAGTIGQLPEERALLDRVLSRGLVDLGRAADPDNDRLFTWWPPWRGMRQRNIGWRIDYVLASRALADRATRCPVLGDMGTSDHAIVLAEFGDVPGAGA